MLIYNLVTQNFPLWLRRINRLPIPMHLWNFLGLYTVGLAAVMAGGCPLRQLILAGQGNNDSAVTFLGLLVGAAFAIILVGQLAPTVYPLRAKSHVSCALPFYGHWGSFSAASKKRLSFPIKGGCNNGNC